MRLLRVGFSCGIGGGGAAALTGCGRASPPVAHAARKVAPGRRRRTAGGSCAPPAPSSRSASTPCRCRRSPGQGGRLTLVKLAPNGATVKDGDVIAEFDRTQQLDNAREAQARFDDLSHQVEQRQAQNRADAAKRDGRVAAGPKPTSPRRRSSCAKARCWPKSSGCRTRCGWKPPRAHVASLQEVDEVARRGRRRRAAHSRTAARPPEGQPGARACSNADKLQVKAPLAGMVALENIWKGGSMGQAQEGDQLWPGPGADAHLRSVRDGGAAGGRRARRRRAGGQARRRRCGWTPTRTWSSAAHFDSASPAAASALGSPIKTFAARFRLERTDPHLLPDLSAAVVIEPAGGRQSK